MDPFSPFTLMFRASPSQMEVLELPEASHFDTHFELADGASEWHAALRRVLAEE